MAVEVLEEQTEWGTRAVMLCTTTGYAFGPIFNDRAEAEQFQRWLGTGARRFRDDELIDLLSDFRKLEENRGFDV